MEQNKTSDSSEKKVLMFDFDGVVVDSLDCFHSCLAQACEENGFPKFTDRQSLLDLFDANMVDGMVSSGIPRRAIPDILRRLGVLLAQSDGKYDFFPAMCDVLKSLAERHTLYGITSNLTSVVEDFFAKNKLFVMQEILGSDKATSKHHKMEEVKRRNPGCRFYYIGDTGGDIIEGKASNVITVAAGWGWHDKDRLMKTSPDFFAKSPDELLAIFC